MAQKDKLSERAQPFLEPDETIQQLLVAQTGPNPYAFGALIAFLGKIRFVVVTDRAIVLLNMSTFFPKPTQLVARLPRDTRLGPWEGKLWSSVILNGERHWVRRHYRTELEAADAALPTD